MCVKSVVQFESTKHQRFSLGTLVSSYSNTGPMWDGLFWSSRENILGIVPTDRVIQHKINKGAVLYFTMLYFTLFYFTLLDFAYN